MKIVSLIAVVAIVLAGCGTTGNKIVPSNRFKDSEREITLAQDSHAKDITIDKTTVDKHGNTNRVNIQIKGLEGKNNPDVIDASGRANATAIMAYSQLLQAQMQLGQDLLDKALRVYAMSQGVPVPSSEPKSILGKEAVKVDGKTYTLRRKPDIYIGEDGELYRLEGDTMNPLQ